VLAESNPSIFEERKEVKGYEEVDLFCACLGLDDQPSRHGNWVQSQGVGKAGGVTEEQKPPEAPAPAPPPAPPEQKPEEKPTEAPKQ